MNLKKTILLVFILVQASLFAQKPNVIIIKTEDHGYGGKTLISEYKRIVPSPNSPIIPNEEFVGKSDAGAYGDFVYQTDWVIGQVLDALKEKEEDPGKCINLFDL